MPGPAANGITNGPLSSPSQANAFNPPGGNSCYFMGGTSPTYPNAWDTNDGGENRWVDVEVTPASSSSSPTPTPTPTSRHRRRRPRSPIPARSSCSSREIGEVECSDGSC